MTSKLCHAVTYSTSTCLRLSTYFALSSTEKAKTASTGHMRYKQCHATQMKYSGNVQNRANAATSAICNDRCKADNGLIPDRLAATKNMANSRGLKSCVNI